MGSKNKCRHISGKSSNLRIFEEVNYITFRGESSKQDKRKLFEISERRCPSITSFLLARDFSFPFHSPMYAYRRNGLVALFAPGRPERIVLWLLVWLVGTLGMFPIFGGDLGKAKGSPIANAFFIAFRQAVPNSDWSRVRGQPTG